jgi:sugar lactone lactonase YvrE
MNKTNQSIAALAGGLLVILVVGSQTGHVQEQDLPGAGFAAIPGQIGGQDAFGPYDVVENWPKPMSESLPGHEGWTYSVTMDVFAENPDRVFLVQKGELPIMERPGESVWLPELGPGFHYPNFRLPLRQAGGAIPNGDQLEEPGGGRAGIDWRWEHCVLVVDREGNIVEEWTQWDHLWYRPHDVEISPYDPDKHVWIVDADGHFVAKFTNDGSELVLTLGTPGEPGEGDNHLSRPTFLTFMDENTMYLADGYDNTRVIKYDMDGNILAQWGERGLGSGQETRPGYWNNVHGIAVDPTTRRVFVNDRDNGRVQVFDEDGEYLYEWSFWKGRRGQPHDIHSFIVTSDNKLWAADQGTHKIVGYDLEGHYLYSWGSWGDYPGGMWGVHGMSTDKEGNFYTASVNNGRIMKFRPRDGANSDFLVGKPWPGVW